MFCIRLCERIRRLYRNDEGATIIEYAIVVPILFLLVFAVIEFSMIMYAQSILDNATTIASRFGITGDNYTDEWVNDGSRGPSIEDRAAFIEETILRNSRGLLDSSNIKIDTEVFDDFTSPPPSADGENDGYGGSNQAVLYNVTYEWKIITPIVGKFFLSKDGKPIYEIRSTVLVKNEESDKF